VNIVYPTSFVGVALQATIESMNSNECAQCTCKLLMSAYYLDPHMQRVIAQFCDYLYVKYFHDNWRKRLSGFMVSQTRP